MNSKKDDEPHNHIARPVMNPDDYRDDIADFDLTKEQQDELLNTLWHIMRTMVDIGWGVEYMGILLPEIFQKAGQDSGNMLEQTDSKQSDIKGQSS